jgi:hypothetical protein
LIRCSYEPTIQDKFAFFSGMIQVLGFPCDGPPLRQILSDSMWGVTGQSMDALSEPNKNLLERLLNEHPKDLIDLLEELPRWSRGRKRGASSYEMAIPATG